MLCEEAATGGVLLKVVLKNFANLTKSLSRQGVFFELGHFDKHSSTAQERRSLQGKISVFFPGKTGKMYFK